MLTKKQCETKLEELKYLKAIQNENTETGGEYIAHLTRLEHAYRKELSNAISRILSAEDDPESWISKGMYA